MINFNFFQPPTIIVQLRNSGRMLQSLEMVKFGEEFEVLVHPGTVICTSLIPFLMEDGI